MEKNLSVGPKMLADMFGGFLTWMGSAMIIMPLVWWATASVSLANIDRHAVMVGIVGAPITYLITGLIEHLRGKPEKAMRAEANSARIIAALSGCEQ